MPRSGTSADDEAKHDTEKGPEEVAVKQNKDQDERPRSDPMSWPVSSSSQTGQSGLVNRTIRFL
jgi:hypothetical protein